MTLLTTNFSLPKPESTEPPDGPAQIGALADAVDTELDDIAPAQIQDQTAGKLLIANASGVITGTAMSGDVTVSPTGVASIAAGAVDTAELAGDAVNATKITDDAVNGTHLAPGAVSAAALGTGAVTNSKLGTDAVNGAKIADLAVDTEHLATDAVTSAKIGNDQVNSQHYAAGSIDLEHMSHNSVSANQYVDESIYREHLRRDIIGPLQIEDDAVNGSHLDAGAVTEPAISDNAVTSRKLNLTANNTATSQVTGVLLTDTKVHSSGSLAAGTWLVLFSGSVFGLGNAEAGGTIRLKSTTTHCTVTFADNDDSSPGTTWAVSLNTIITLSSTDTFDIWLQSGSGTLALGMLGGGILTCLRVG